MHTCAAQQEWRESLQKGLDREQEWLESLQEGLDREQEWLEREQEWLDSEQELLNSEQERLNNPLKASVLTMIGVLISLTREERGGGAMIWFVTEACGCTVCSSRDC